MNVRHVLVGFAALVWVTWPTAARGSEEGPPFRCLAFSSDGTLLAAAAGEPKDPGLLVIWETASLKVRWRHREPTGIPAVAFAPDGQTLAIGTFAEQAKLFEVKSGKVTAVLPGHGQAARSVGFSPDGKSLAVGSYDKFIKIWDIAAREVRQTLTGHEGWVYSVAFSPDGRRLTSSSADRSTRVWDLADGKVLSTCRHGSLARRSFFTKDDQLLASVSWDAKATVRDVKTGQIRAQFWGQDALAGSPDGTMWAADHGRLVAVYRVNLQPAGAAGNKRLTELLAQWDDDFYQTRESASKAIIALGWWVVPELDKLLKETTSAEIRIRARQARAQIRRPEPVAVLRGHGGEIEWLDFSPNGKTLASAGRDGTVRLWSTTTWQEIAVLRHQDEGPKR